jgi:hypothetical protein
MRLKHSTSGVGGMGSAGVIGMPTSGRWSSSGNRRDTPVSGPMHRPSADGPSGRSPLPTGLYRIAPTFRQSICSVHEADLPHAFTPTRYARTPARCEQQFTGDTAMFTNRKIALSCATAILTLIGLFAISAAVMNLSVESRVVASNAPDLVCTRFLC